MTDVFSHQQIIDPETELKLIVLKYKNLRDSGKDIIIAIAPEYGSNLVKFNVGGKDIFYTDKQAIKEGKWTGCFVLWPLPNRYDRDGKKEYIFEEKTVSLEDIHRKEGNTPLIHGLVDNQKWEHYQPVVCKNSVSLKTYITVTENSPLYFHYPYESKLTLRYTLRKDSLEVAYTVNNNSNRNIPSVFALHPYYKLLDGRDKTLVRVPARSVMKTTQDLLPTGELLDVGDTLYDLRNPKPVKCMIFDDVWTDLEPEQYPSIIYSKTGLQITHKTSEDFTHVVLYTQMESSLGFICLEPQTGSTNAINLDDKATKQNNVSLRKTAHLIRIPPGTTHTGKITFAVGFII